MSRCSVLVPARLAQAASLRVSSGRRSPLSELACVGEVSGSGEGLRQPPRRPVQTNPPATAPSPPAQRDFPPRSLGQAESQVQRPRAPERERFIPDGATVQKNSSNTKGGERFIPDGATVQKNSSNTKGGRNGDGRRGFDAGFRKQEKRPEQLSKIRDRSVRPCRALKIDLLHRLTERRRLPPAFNLYHTSAQVPITTRVCFLHSATTVHTTRKNCARPH